MSASAAAPGAVLWEARTDSVYCINWSSGSSGAPKTYSRLFIMSLQNASSTVPCLVQNSLTNYTMKSQSLRSRTKNCRLYTSKHDPS